MRVLRVISILSLFAVSACGNVKTGSQDLRTKGYGSMTLAGSTNPFLSQAEQCSEEPNITSPHSSSAFYQYHGCLGAQSGANSVNLFSSDNFSKSVVIFPVAYNNGIRPYIINPSAPPATRFYSATVNVTPSGVIANFGNTTITGVFVVDQTHAAAFANCLAGGEVYACASNAGFTYAYGSFL